MIKPATSLTTKKNINALLQTVCDTQYQNNSATTTPHSNTGIKGLYY